MADMLTKLSSKYKCDKSDKNHKYTPLYHERFEHYRNMKFNMLEYGFGIGNSVKMWLEYFKKVKLVTVDIRQPISDAIVKNYIKNGRLDYIVSSQIDKDLIVRKLNKYNKFFLIIDDASHVAEDQQYTLSFSLPYVVPGGWYVLEDLKCKRSHSKQFGIEAEKTLNVLNNYIKSKKFRSKILSKEENLKIESRIKDVKIFDKIAFIKTRA